MTGRNGSDVIGRYLCEQIRLNVAGYLPVLEGTPTRNDRGIGGEHIYMPRFNHRPGKSRDYLRGFGAQFWNTGAATYGAHGGSSSIPGFGAPTRHAMFPAGCRFSYMSWCVFAISSNEKVWPRHGSTLPATTRSFRPFA